MFAQIKLYGWVFMFAICFGQRERPQPTLCFCKDDLDSACLVVISHSDQSVPSRIRISLRQHSRWVRFLWILIQRKHMLRWKEVVDLTNPAITSWYGKSPIIYKFCYIPGGWDRDFWSINSICLRSSIDLTIFRFWHLQALIMNSTKKSLEDSDSVRLLGSFVAKNPNTNGKFQHCFSINQKVQVSSEFNRLFFVSLAIFYKLYITYRSPLFLVGKLFRKLDLTHCPGCLPFQDYNSSLYSGKYQMSPPEEVAPDRPDTGICTLTLEIPWVHPPNPAMQ